MNESAPRTLGQNLKAAISESNAVEAITRMGREAREAARKLASAPAADRDRALRMAASALHDRSRRLLEASEADVTAARANGLPAPLVDRLALTPTRIEAMVEGVKAIAAQPNPVGAVLAEWDRPNGLRIARVAVPLGVIGVIFESRPNVTADAGALCVKSGNAVILRAGSEALRAASVIADAMADGLHAAGLPRAAVQLIRHADRALVGAMLAADGLIDVIIPRGGRGLIERVQQESRVPVLAHLDGLCHVYVHASARADMARAITVNAKMRRTSICGAAETLLVDADAAEALLPGIIDDLVAAGCALRGCDRTRAIDTRVTPATEADWGTEYLDAILSIRVVDGIDAALAHIDRHGSRHTDSIVTEDTAAAERFLTSVDSAIVLHNASTQFADGGEFGMGAEIGIATGRLHARGPVGANQLTTYKYVVHGTGQTRP